MKRYVSLSVLIMVFFFMCSANPAGDSAVNTDNPGEKINLEDYLKAGKTNIVDFYSNFCPPCRQISPLLSKLDAKREDIAVVKVDINRKGVRGIDWGSPLSRQFNLRAIPHFKIYDGSGKLILEGEEAIRRVYQLLQQEGIR
ncbi:MAG: thioredoxin family protein [Candidatus Aminicenantes bacterium]|nr:thioredoxin family protein [Candidatus Aminicenantes bacterium]